MTTSPRQTLCSLLLSALLLAPPAQAEETMTVRARKEPRRHADVRIGLSTSATRPVICASVSPIDILGFEACGTGSGFLHHDPEPELAQFVAHLKLASWETRFGWLQPRLGLGFAELQVGEDAPGFYFTSTGPTGVETAGPLARASLQLVHPLGERVGMVTELVVNTAYLKHAPELVRPRSPWQAGAMLALGVAF